MRYRAPLRGHRYAMLSRCARLEPTRALTLPPRELQIQKEPHCCSSSFKMAVREGFEPSIRCRIHTFQACSFSHSDTSPLLNSYLGVSSSPFNRAVRWLHRTLGVLFSSSASQTGQPLGHLTVFDSLFKALNLALSISFG